MILCSCNVLTAVRIAETAGRLAAEAPGRPVTPGRVLRALGMRASCATCFPLIRAELAKIGLAITCPEPLATAAESYEDAASAL